MAEYRLPACGGGIVRTGDGAGIPQAAGNPDWERYLAWRAEGNEPDPVEVADAIPARVEAVEALYAAKLLAGFEHGGKRFELDDASQQKISALATASGFYVLGVGGVTWSPIPFVAADNSVQVFATALDFIAFANAAKTAAQALFARRYALKTACRAAATAEELEGIDIEAGWPEV